MAAVETGSGMQDVRARLEQELRELEGTVETLKAENAGESSELSTLDQHPADTASDIADADREMARIDLPDNRREELLAAVARIDAGTYGTCADCGQQISEARLQVRPEAARCVECQATFEERS